MEHRQDGGRLRVIQPQSRQAQAKKEHSVETVHPALRASIARRFFGLRQSVHRLAIAENLPHAVIEEIAREAKGSPPLLRQAA
jgi:hypothetical protein